MEMINKRLGLSEKQEEKVIPILDSRSEKINLLLGERKSMDRGNMETMRGSIEKINDETNNKLRLVLTADQMKEYIKIRNEEREKMRKRRKPEGRKGTKVGILFGLFRRDLRMFTIVKKSRPSCFIEFCVLKKLFSFALALE